MSDIEFTGLAEAIDLIEHGGTRDSLRMAVEKIKVDQGIMAKMSTTLTVVRNMYPDEMQMVENALETIEELEK